MAEETLDRIHLKLADEVLKIGRNRIEVCRKSQTITIQGPLEQPMVRKAHLWLLLESGPSYDWKIVVTDPGST